MNIKPVLMYLWVMYTCFSTFPVRAEYDPMLSNEKIYVRTEQILLSQDYIEVELPQGVFSTDLLCKDSYSYYVLSSRLMQVRGNHECESCGWECGSGRDLIRHKDEYHW